MPCISEFFGIAVFMYYDDHNPPHFRASYGDCEAEISIRDLVTRKGVIPRRALGLVLEWANEHRVELLENWELARRRLPLKPIVPLE